ncbi:MAG: cache domain-containing protein [Candidatus Nitrosocosmicus sp.]
MNRFTVIVVVIVCVVSTLFFISANNQNLFAFSSYPQMTNQTKQILQNQNNTLIVLADSIEDILNQAIDILNVTSKDPAVSNTLYANNISTKYMGIPEDQDVSKRQVAKNIINTDKDFENVYFLLPNGNVYIGEPYENQKQLPRLNYADRDWYKGISSLVMKASSDQNKTNVNGTNNSLAYISSVFMSASINKPAIGIAVPVYDNNWKVSKPSLLGYWVGILTLDKIQKIIDSLTLTNSQRIIVFDHNGTALLDSSFDHATKSNNNNKKNLTFFYNLAGVKNALTGKNGIVTDTINGTKTLSLYRPIDAHSHTWGILFLSQ